MMNNKTLILSSAEVRKLISMPDVLKAVKKAFILHGKGRVQMPAKIYLHIDKFAGDFRAMPAYIEGMEVCGLKWVNVHPKNRRFGLSSVMGIIILSDPRTGLPLSIMDATYITYLRTGASGGIAAKCLARTGSSIVGIVGCGAQGRAQLEALSALFRITTVYLYDADPERAKRLKEAIIRDTSLLKRDVSLIIASSISDCVMKADIVVTTTPSIKPIIRSKWIKNGTHINAIGADAKGKEELEPVLLKRAKIVVDDREQACHSGEINVPLSKGLLKIKDIHATLGEVLIGRKRGRANAGEITIFDSTGLAVQDIAVASLVYERAVKKRAGRSIAIL